MSVEHARARKAELIAQVRNGTPPLWTPKAGWADQFSDDEIWEGWRRASKAGPTLPMMVAVVLVESVIDGVPLSPEASDG